MQASHEEPYDCHSTDMRISHQVHTPQVEKQTFLTSVTQARMKLNETKFLNGLTFFFCSLEMVTELYQMQIKLSCFNLQVILVMKCMTIDLVLYDYFGRF